MAPPVPSRVSTRRALLAAAAGTALAAVASYRYGPRVYNARRLAALRGRRIYDENANAEALVARAVDDARREQKRPLVVLGGNWCQWCLVLDDLMETDAEIRALVAARFVLVHLDGDAAESLDSAWGHPTRLGVPVMVFLDRDGRVAHVQETITLESFGGRILHHDRGRVLASLRAWA